MLLLVAVVVNGSCRCCIGVCNCWLPVCGYGLQASRASKGRVKREGLKVRRFFVYQIFTLFCRLWWKDENIFVFARCDFGLC